MINVFKHLLPNARAWRLTTEKKLKSFFAGLSTVVDDARQYYDNIYDDLNPQTTRELALWEDQFALPNTGLNEQQRRDRLDATWKALGGQDPRYIQDTLQAAGFDVYVHEWWEPNPKQPIGGSVNNDVTPVARNPFNYLWDGLSPREFIGAGYDQAFCGGDFAFANSQKDPPGYPLVNKVIVSKTTVIGAGYEQAFCGGDFMASGATIVNYDYKQYVMPTDPDTFPYYLYIGGKNFPDQATIPISRKNEFEALCLKICPTEQWLGILVSYT